MCIDMRIYINVHVYVCAYMYTSLFTHTHTHTYIYIYICIYIHICVCMHFTRPCLQHAFDICSRGSTITNAWVVTCICCRIQCKALFAIMPSLPLRTSSFARGSKPTWYTEHAEILSKHRDIRFARYDTVSERLRKWTRAQLGSARRISNPLSVVVSFGSSCCLKAAE